ncbi:DUF2809 domain-containing protein [Asticcacaulis sp. 201]|uniref:ribosomal maturation YjgA family protein n=1 Tax=Asticcacaulis sp. 201 TaxID=3028787 RepID=UPI0029161F6F|nr:DUF2809 domain-containing protein [Asticcacaulis sp. 201]MDV6331848.1 DUF2809 domain-containing protein [Asticcacaulis sp. 201]
MLRFQPGYAGAAVAVFLIEVLIAVFMHDALVRPYVGDSLVVVLIYLTIRAIMPMPVIPAVALTLIIAVAVEVGQFYNLVGVLGLGDNALARVVLGTGFDPKDLVAYAVGGLGLIIAESARKPRFM